MYYIVIYTIIGTSFAIYIYCQNTWGSRGIVISGIGNVVFGNSIKNINTGIDITYADGIVFNGNRVYDCDTGINIFQSFRCNVSSNICMRGEGLSSDYSDTQYTIVIDDSSKFSLIYGNNILGKNYVNNGSTQNTVTDNKYA